LQPPAPTYGCSLPHLRLQAAARADKEAKAAEAKAAKESEMEARAAAKAEQARYLVITPRGGGEGGSVSVAQSNHRVIRLPSPSP
jgi:hypothetical protein